MELYRSERTEQNLTLVNTSITSVVGGRIPHLSDLAERDIGLARDYVVSSWLAVKFQEVIPLLSWEINVTENQLRRMSLLELSEYQKLVEEMLNNVDDYVNRIEEELSYI